MLTEKELTDALITNISGWDWSINTKFSIDEKTGKSLVNEYRALVAKCQELEKRVEANKLLGGVL